MIVQLRQAYASRDEVPSIDRVDDTIFQRTYFTDCMGCGFCHDACCSYGAEIGMENVQRLLAIADQLEPYVGQPRTQWFTDQVVDDSETPGGRYTRTRIVEGACVFLSRQGRGCLLHAFCLTAGCNVHTLKPIVCSLFPVTFDHGLLRPAYEVQENSLVCLDTGQTLYHGARASLRYYFGEACIRELDAIAAQIRR